jgi:hypothetical protein
MNDWPSYEDLIMCVEYYYAHFSRAKAPSCEEARIKKTSEDMEAFGYTS